MGHFPIQHREAIPRGWEETGTDGGGACLGQREWLSWNSSRACRDAGEVVTLPGARLTSFPPMASNIFSSCTRSCCVLFMRMQGWGCKQSRESGLRTPPQSLPHPLPGTPGRFQGLGPEEDPIGSSENGRQHLGPDSWECWGVGSGD